MRQALATLALVAATAAVPLGTLCEWQCARETRRDTAPSRPSCHEAEAPASSSVPGVAAEAEHCDGHDQVPAVTAARQAGRLVGAAGVTTTTVTGTYAAARSLAPWGLATSPPDLSPPRARISVLRI